MDRADRSAATIRKDLRIARSLASSCADVNDLFARTRYWRGTGRLGQCIMIIGT